jgi:sodium/bile acid cotransporter 7
MAVIEFLLLIIFKTIAWTLLRLLFPGNCTLRVTGIFCCTQKTVALGIPLINAMFEDSPYLGIYSIPLISWYVSQFLIGSFLAPRLRKFVENEGDKQMC